ncbi:hypothetical protein [Skermanella aerolata]|nr:hypothetical protein [Skermanella aerolata]KJB91887.1 hypothetical protein N826_25560 [Skermanella aerolata KACC 11604]
MDAVVVADPLDGVGAVAVARIGAPAGADARQQEIGVDGVAADGFAKKLGRTGEFIIFSWLGAGALEGSILME